MFLGRRIMIEVQEENCQFLLVIAYVGHAPAVAISLADNVLRSKCPIL